ncbi:DUF2163 domain-containing protein [Sphingobium phenoxybenzoativorans]|uniref:DUF2163 domain-containing protein n=1 Tax=Sphingobium phenoxybenzoativorans TaxID=1592790 RepID=A0A975K892_9SPHN|nr:DUF2163 domain-containing protein [Sphingobium phenoxybenzoativorans]QUT06302.1 DUF2163 domain-containing protein [Sphingobium phenoxybenzoativorans]
MSAAREILAQELAALAFCWRLERRDGVTIGLTSHDRDMAIGGVTYRAAPGMLPSAVRRGSGLTPESMDVRGALSSDALHGPDLEAGRWDGASLWLMLTEWTDPGALWLELARGEIGAVEREGDAFTAELVGPGAVLDMPVAPETSPDCRAMLGDAACRADMAARRRVVRVAGVEGQAVSVAGGGLAAGAYAFGSLRWMTGANSGIVQAVMASDAGGVTLADPPAFAVAAGTLALLTEGCDKRIATCSARFGNAANFRGEPYLPGNDLLTRYPGG